MAFEGHILDSNTVALWRCDESSGNLIDESSNAFHLTAFNSPSSSLTVGQVEGCRILNGTNQYFLCSGSTDLDNVFFSGSEYTFECWINLSSSWDASPWASHHQLFAYATDAAATGRVFSLSFHKGGRRPIVGWNIEGGSHLDLDTPTYVGMISGERWHHYALRKRLAVTGSLCHLDLFHNGANIYTWQNKAQAGNWSSARLNLGSFDNLAFNFWPGMIDDIRLSRVARTDEEIAESFFRGRGRALQTTQFRTWKAGYRSLY